jgi:hypothetical protein
MGEACTTIAFGAMNIDRLSEDDHWIDVLSNLARKCAKYPELVYEDGRAHMKNQTVAFMIVSSYEAEPSWLGLELWTSSTDSYATMDLAGTVLFYEERAREAWGTLRRIVQIEFGVEWPEGKLLISNDHT